MEIEKGVSRREFLSTGAVAATGIVTTGFTTNDNDASTQIIDHDLVASTYNSKSGHDVTTDAVHAGERKDESSYPIYQGTTNPQYKRAGNPTIN